MRSHPGCHWASSGSQAWSACDAAEDGRRAQCLGSLAPARLEATGPDAEHPGDRATASHGSRARASGRLPAPLVGRTGRTVTTLIIVDQESGRVVMYYR